ncbi:MAG: NAD(P)/FAD-dependent oxidoreductase [Myxococcota bacterium]
MSETRHAQSYKRNPVRENYDVIVIGSGIGGLAAAALLAKHGRKKVLVLERHYTAGGFTHVFHRPGYEWDVGVHYVGDVAPGSVLRAMFDEVTNGQLAWADMGEVYDRVVLGDEVYDFPKGREKLRTYLKGRFPGEEAAIDAYFQAVRSALSTSLSFHAEKALPGPVAAVAGPFLRHRFLRWSDRTTRDVLEGFTRNQKLIGVLTAQFGDYGLPPSEASFMVHAMVANHYFDGGYYPVGGSARIAETIIPVIERAGGKVLVSAEVASLVVQDGRVVGVKMASDGAELRAPVVVSDAGVANTFTRLLPREVALRHGLLEKLRTVRPSSAHLCLYLGFKHTAQELGLPRHNLWIYPHERHEDGITASRANPDAELPVVYVSFPAAKDPDFARRHPGRATVEVITAAPHSWFAQWDGTTWKKRGADYDALKQRLTERLLESLYRQLPQLRGKVDFQELSTPLTTQHFANHASGEIYGVDHTPQRFRQRFLKPATAVPGLFLTGQDVVTCGVAGALFGGALTASAVLKGNLVATILRSAQEKARPQAA